MTCTMYEIVKTPVGNLLIVSNGVGLTEIRFHTKSPDLPEWSRGGLIVESAAQQLAEYFEQSREVFDLPLSPSGTSFQLKVWNALQEIPYGETKSYSEIARRIGSPKACRAVGLANGKNPISIVIPCHRVIGSDGSLTGFGGGLPTKKKLLTLEERSLPLFQTS